LSQKVDPSRTVLTLALLCLLCLPFTLQAAGNGGSDGAYLRLPLGAAATGMGGAGTAMSATYYAAWWNPALPSTLREQRIAGGTGLRSLGRMDAYAAYDFRIPQRVGLGILALYRGDPSIGTLYDLDERVLPKTSYTTMTIKTALSYLVTRRLSAGIAINILHQSLPTYGETSVIEYASATSIGSCDVAVAYAASEKWRFAAVLKNLGAKMEWQMGDFSPLVEDQPVPTLVLGRSYATALAAKPLVWLLDVKAYALDGAGAPVDRAELVLCTGAEWRRWDNFYVRAGLGDLSFTSDLFRGVKNYAEDMGSQFTAGFSYRPSKKQNSLWINYSAATDKVWAGVDQQLDVCLGF